MQKSKVYLHVYVAFSTIEKLCGHHLHNIMFIVVSESMVDSNKVYIHIWGYKLSV